MNAVVKVLCVHSNPNFSLPWQRKRQFTSTSSGFMVRAEDGQRWLLTNAHSVEYHAQVGRLFSNAYCPALAAIDQHDLQLSYPCSTPSRLSMAKECDNCVTQIMSIVLTSV